MAKKTAEVAGDIGLSGSKLKKLTVRNYRCIGSEGVTVELDNIVVLVGPNNVGKSTILRAYELVMEHKDITIEDLCNNKYDSLNPPTVELETWLGSEKPGSDWIMVEGETGEYIRERWTWGEDLKIVRQGFNNSIQTWDDKVPWGAANVASARRPKPHRVQAFASPEQQAKNVASLLVSWLKDKASETSGEDAGENESALAKLSETYKQIVEKLTTDTRDRVASAETAITDIVGKVFSGYAVKFEVTPAAPTDKILDSVISTPNIRMGPATGHLAKIEDQGSGAQRTLLWATLKLLAEEAKAAVKASRGKAKKKSTDLDDPAETASAEPKRPNVLLIDEPEICLHPDAVREACKTLYDLAEANSNWQVMVTTHSPVFIDLSRDNTTVVRVQQAASGSISGTTIFRPSKAQLTDDDQDLLKVNNLWDPYVAEFFFGGRTVLVEGDTEYSVFRQLIASDPTLSDVHVIRARGKAILVPLIKILNHFGQGYGVLHDADYPTVETKNGTRTNSMWTENGKIREAVDVAPSTVSVRLVASIRNFEQAMFGADAKSEKPYSAWLQVKESAELRKKALDLLVGLLDHSKTLPTGFNEWAELESLKATVKGDAVV